MSSRNKHSNRRKPPAQDDLAEQALGFGAQAVIRLDAFGGAKNWGGAEILIIMPGAISALVSCHGLLIFAPPSTSLGAEDSFHLRQLIEQAEARKLRWVIDEAPRPPRLDLEAFRALLGEDG